MGDSGHGLQESAMNSQPQQTSERRLKAVSGLSPDGRLDGTARQTGGTHQRSFVSACNRPKADSH